jgi:hypothetical protein
MRALACLASLVLVATASLACTAPAEESADPQSSGSEVNEEDARKALPEEVRVIVQKDASSEKLCLVYERANGGVPGKLKASRCAVGGPMKVGSEKCALGGDGCWRVGRMDAWRAVRTEGNDILVDLIHLDGAHLSAMPGDAATVAATPEKKSLLGLVGGHLTTPMSGSSATHTPASEWCATLEERGGDVVLGLKKFWNEGQSGPKDYTGCATVTLEHAQQVFGPLPVGMRAGDDCSAASLANLAIAQGAPAGVMACTHAGLVCVGGKWVAKSCAEQAMSSRSFCSRKGYCDGSMAYPAEDAPCSNPKDSDALSCGTVLGSAATGNTEMTCQDGFWKKQSCASFAKSSRSYCAQNGRCDSVGH